MIDIKDKKDCSGCSACKNVCPRNAIEMWEDEEGFLYPKIRYELCTNCGLCERKCPVLNHGKKSILQEEKPRILEAYAGISLDEEIRKQSSSGGIFTEMAKKILEDNGVIFGAVFDENFNVVHSEVTEEADLSRIRGSKYVQSAINDTYKKAKEYLDSGRKVLYTGTPCQIEGLYSFLRKDYDNLYTQDLICHGVPSKKIWNEYLKYRKSTDKAMPTDISFRSKEEYNWTNFAMSFKYEDKKVEINHDDDTYMQIFLSDIALRPSCYSCKFKEKNRKADITLADFWGINNVLPNMNDEKGTSLVIVHSENGKKLLESISEKIKLEPVNFESAIVSNRNMVENANINKRKSDIFRDIGNIEFEDIIKRYI